MHCISHIMKGLGHKTERPRNPTACGIGMGMDANPNQLDWYEGFAG